MDRNGEEPIMSYVNDTLPLNVSLEEYLALPDKPDKENDRTNSFSILMDVWGEADRAVSMKGRSRESNEYDRNGQRRDPICR